MRRMLLVIKTPMKSETGLFHIYNVTRWLGLSNQVDSFCPPIFKKVVAWWYSQIWGAYWVMVSFFGTVIARDIFWVMVSKIGTLLARPKLRMIIIIVRVFENDNQYYKCILKMKINIINAFWKWENVKWRPAKTWPIWLTIINKKTTAVLSRHYVPRFNCNFLNCHLIISHFKMDRHLLDNFFAHQMVATNHRTAFSGQTTLIDSLWPEIKPPEASMHSYTTLQLISGLKLVK